MWHAGLISGLVCTITSELYHLSATFCKEERNLTFPVLWQSVKLGNAASLFKHDFERRVSCVFDALTRFIYHL